MNIEEKKLTDEEIVKALECCVKEEHKDCTHCGEFVSQFDCMRNAISNALDLIHRLQDENKRLKSTKYRASWKEKFFNLKKEFDKELAEHEEFTKKAKAEIERLTEEKWQVQDDLDNYHAMWQESEKKNTELQKQVDELKKENARLDKNVKWFQEKIESGELVSEQAVKDTAKEIFQKLYNETIKDGIPAVYCMLTPKEIKDRAKRYGVEVE